MKTTDFIPARYSVYQTDFNPELARNLKIMLDGVVQDKVLEYDCEEGHLTRYVTDESGDLIIDRKREEAKRETVRGLVTVEWRG